MAKSNDSDPVSPVDDATVAAEADASTDSNPTPTTPPLDASTSAPAPPINPLTGAPEHPDLPAFLAEKASDFDTMLQPFCRGDGSPTQTCIHWRGGHCPILLNAYEGAGRAALVQDCIHREFPEPPAATG